MNVPEPIERLCKWTINAERVEQSDETWSNAYYTQYRNASLIIGVLAVLTAWSDHAGTLEWYHIVFVTAFALYACLPIAGAYLYMAERGDGQ